MYSTRETSKKEKRAAARAALKKLEKAGASIVSDFEKATTTAPTRSAPASINATLGGRGIRQTERQATLADTRAILDEVDAGLKKANRIAHPERTKKRLARRKVINYVSVKDGQYVRQTPPNSETIRAAFETFSPLEKKTYGKKLLKSFAQRGDSAAKFNSERTADRLLKGKAPIPAFLRQYDPDGFDAMVQGRAEEVMEGEYEQTSDLHRALEFGALVGTGGAVGVVAKGAQAGLKGVQAIRAARAAEVGAESLVGGTRGARALTAGTRATTTTGRTAGGVRSARTALGAKLGRAGQAARTSRAGQVAARAGATKGGKIAKGTAKAATYPVAHPLKSAALYEAGAAGLAVPAAVSEGSLDPIKEAVLGGTGALNDVKNAVGDKLSEFGVIGNAARDILEIPAAVVPSTYLLGEAMYEAARGDDTKLREQVNGYLNEGLLPALAKGDIEQALTALKEHPVYSALEVGGAGALADRGAGIVTGTKTERAPLELAGGQGQIERSYSRGAARNALQRRGDRKREQREGGQRATGKETDRYLGGGVLKSGKADRFVGGQEVARRAARQEEQAFIEDALPSARPKGLGEATARANREGVHVVSALGIRARSFTQDLDTYLGKIDGARDRLKERLSDPSLRPDEKSAIEVQLKQNASLREQVQNVRDNGDPETIYTAAGEITPRMRDREEELIKEDAGLDGAQAERARLIPAGVLHLGLKHGTPPEGGPAQILDKDGNPITTDEIKAQLREIGVEPDAIPFVSQRPRVSGGGAAFYKPFYPDRQSIRQGKRTGASTTEGFDASADAMIEQLVGTRGTVEAVRTYDHAIQTFAPKLESGTTRSFTSGRTAAQAVRNPEEFGLDPRIQWRAVKVNPRQARVLEDLADGPGDEIAAQLDLAATWSRADAGRGGVAELEVAEGKFTVIPESVAKRFDEHFARPQMARMALQVVNQAFKGTVLPYSPKWIAGNFADINVRAAIAGHPPLQRIFSLNRRFADKIWDEAEAIDPVATARARGALTPGAHMASVPKTRVTRSARQFEGTQMAPIAHRMTALREAPGLRTLANFHDRYKTWVFQKNDEWIESPAQEAQLGKLLKKEAVEKGYIKKWESVWKLEDDARADLANGLLNTDKQLKYAEGIERVFGQWTANSPAMRGLLVDFAPFGMWTRAATKFVFKTMPVDHPVLTAIIAASELMTLEERKALGFSLESEDPLPDNLRGGLPLPGGDIRGGVTGLSSFGYFSDPAGAFASTILPQFSGPIQSLQGLDWTGSQLTDADGKPVDPQTRFLAAFTTGAEAYAPFLSVAQRVSTVGGAEDAPDAAADLLLGKEVDEDFADALRYKRSIDIFSRETEDSDSGGTYSIPEIGGGGASGGYGGSGAAGSYSSGGASSGYGG